MIWKPEKIQEVIDGDRGHHDFSPRGHVVGLAMSHIEAIYLFWSSGDNHKLSFYVEGAF
tara:strand:- start:74175 stop:74351 length:177 start_codon:yes stop_codon:yes gene_type:complete